MSEYKIEPTICPECGGLSDDDTGPHEDWCSNACPECGGLPDDDTGPHEDWCPKAAPTKGKE